MTVVQLFFAFHMVPSWCTALHGKHGSALKASSAAKPTFPFYVHRRLSSFYLVPKFADRCHVGRCNLDTGDIYITVWRLQFSFRAVSLKIEIIISFKRNFFKTIYIHSSQLKWVPRNINRKGIPKPFLICAKTLNMWYHFWMQLWLKLHKRSQ